MILAETVTSSNILTWIEWSLWDERKLFNCEFCLLINATHASYGFQCFLGGHYSYSSRVGLWRQQRQANGNQTQWPDDPTNGVSLPQFLVNMAHRQQTQTFFTLSPYSVSSDKLKFTGPGRFNTVIQRPTPRPRLYPLQTKRPWRGHGNHQKEVPNKEQQCPSAGNARKRSVKATTRTVAALRVKEAMQQPAFRLLEHAGRNTDFELDIRPTHDGRSGSSS